jgi:hypothetical protein
MYKQRFLVSPKIFAILNRIQSTDGVFYDGEFSKLEDNLKQIDSLIEAKLLKVLKKGNLVVLTKKGENSYKIYLPIYKPTEYAPNT